MGGHALNILESRVNNASLIGIHGIKHNISAVLSDLCCALLSECAQGCLALLAVVADVERDSSRLVRAPVDDKADKVNPYLRPLYDALHDMVPQPKVASMLEVGTIEVAPLAFMRGRTLNDAFIILDEAQNTTHEQMKMFLTRMGFGSRVVVTGDTSQIDLPVNPSSGRARSGLVHALAILDKIPGLAVHHFSKADVVRHPLVGAVVNAYDNAEKDS